MDCFWTQLEDNFVTTWRQHLDNLERTWGQLWENFWNVLAFLDAGEEDNIILWSCSRTKLQFVSPSLNWTIGKSNHCQPRIVQTAQCKLKNKCPFEALHINFTWELYAQTSFEDQLGTTWCSKKIHFWNLLRTNQYVTYGSVWTNWTTAGPISSSIILIELWNPH